MKANIIGQQWKADFGQFTFQLDFHSQTSMSFRAIQPDGGLADATTVEITRTELRPKTVPRGPDGLAQNRMLKAFRRLGLLKVTRAPNSDCGPASNSPPFH